MCGRTCLTLRRDQIQCACSFKGKSTDTYSKPDWIEEHNGGKEYLPSPNIAPTDVTPVLISSHLHRNSTVGDRILKPMIWGIIPPWHKGEFNKHNLNTNNCRIENIKNSKLYGPVLKNGGRCIIVVEGFYEWQTTNKNSKVKQPYYIYGAQKDGIKVDEPETWNNIYDDQTGWKGVQLLYLAGLYSIWRNDDVTMYSYSVITMESYSTLSWLHHRMPTILDSDEQINAWLDTEHVDVDMAISYLRPVQQLYWHKVSTLVNNSRNKSLECNKKVPKTGGDKNAQKTLTNWFKKPDKRKSDEDNSLPPKNFKRF